jgi:hypothetical protein
MKSCLTLIMTMLAVGGCKMDLGDGDAFTGGRSQEKIYGSSQSAIASQPTSKATVIRGKYLIRVALHPIADDDQAQVPTLEGLNASAKGCLCIGAVFLDIKEDFSLAFPNSKARCKLIGDLDLEKILGGFGDKEPGPPPESDGRVLRLAKLANVVFTPPRPFLVGPIAQDLDKFRNYTETRDYQASYTDKATGKSGEGHGQITLNVLDAGTSWTPLFMPQSPFHNILRFEMLSSGFKGIPGTKGLLFERVEFTLNSRPISIPRIKLESKASDLLSSMPSSGSSTSSGGAGGLGQSPLVKIFSKFIKVYIQLDATSFETN